MLRQVDHIGIAVKDLDKSLRDYERLYHVKATHIETMEGADIRMAFIPVGEVMIELLEPLSPGKGMIGEFLSSSEEGFHHICYRVEHLDDLISEMKTAGVRFMTEQSIPGAAGARIIFLNPEETGNVLTELAERDTGE